MKVITVPEPVALSHLDGSPTLANGQQIVIDFKSFLLGRASEQAFTGEKKGMDAALFVFAFKQHLDGQDFELGAGTTVWIEDEEYKALKRSCDQAQLLPEVMCALLPHFQAVKDAKDETPKKAEEK
jgi:hypothetical protein